MVAEGQLLWTPKLGFAASSQMAQYMEWLRSEQGLDFQDYDALRKWSVIESADFWQSIWTYFDVQHDGNCRSVIEGKGMMGVSWFSGARVNYAEHLLRHEAVAENGKTALHHLTETRGRSTLSWMELARQVRIVGTQLRRMGVQSGDRVVSYMPNVPETAVAMIATIAIGAVWSSAAIEFGVRTVADRFQQIAPKVLLAADGYRFAGKDIDRRVEVQKIVNSLPTLEHVIWLPYLDLETASPAIRGLILWADLLEHVDVPAEQFQFERVEQNHPLWVLFSSGTTGLPKPIVHSHVGMLVEHLKVLHLHLNLGHDSTIFFYSTTGWMMWNLLIAALMTGSAVVLYDGSPMHPDESFLWKVVADTRTTCFGASPTFVQLMGKAGVRPGKTFDLTALESIILSGAPSTPESFDWFYEHVKRELWVTSQSGGTEICSGFVGAVPLKPVFAGEIQDRMLGMDIHVWDDERRELLDQVGELVVAKPFPSMPIRFWNDEGEVRYRESYFEYFEGVWRHGDFIRINERGGCYIYGRSDSTLNRYGVRIGSAEIYRAVEEIDEIADSLVVCCELVGGNFFMPLFLRMSGEHVLNDDLRRRVAQHLREHCSPRHVPDCMIQVDAVPYTLTGKKMEVPVRKILMGKSLESAASRDAMTNPHALDWYVEFAAAQPLL